MTPVTHLRGRRVAVFGLGGSGLATALALKAGGATPIVWDDSDKQVEAARAQGLEAQNLEGLDWESVVALVLSPGVPLTHPEPHWTARLARQHGVEIIGDIELFVRERRVTAPGAPFIAITGTNGKSTTTALIAHILTEASREVALGGNIGTAILSLPPPSLQRVHVVECSSFQIDLAPTINPSIAVLLNVTEDHLDRHGTLENYAEVKARLVHGAGRAVIGVDDRISQTIADRLDRSGTTVTRISARLPLADGVYAEGETLFRSLAGAASVVASTGGIPSLRGTHNAQNACAAFAVAEALGIEPVTIARAMKSFPGLPHRMEEVRRIGRMLWVNDSKATNADAAEKALASFETIHWILGGKSKTGGIESLRGFFPKIVKAYLIGAASQDFASTFGNSVPFVEVGTLAQAVKQAAVDTAASEGVVLLSPACASYDQFKNFEDRGNQFRDLVKAL